MVLGNDVMDRLTTVRFNGSELASILIAREFPDVRARLWISDHWYFFVQCSIAYFFTIFGIKLLMRNREPFDLQRPLNAWNFFLAVFSGAGAIFLAPDFMGTLFGKGFQASYCDASTMLTGTSGYWQFLFMLSKLAEFVDTIFIVLRKKPLMFLHWYHHILTLLYGTFSFPDSPAFNRWGIYLNLVVHTFMYGYYCLRSMNVKIPGQVAKMITTGQILQFVLSIYVLATLGIQRYFNDKLKCDYHHPSFLLACVMDATYLALFINFFLKAYVLKGGKAKYRDVKGDEKKKQ